MASRQKDRQKTSEEGGVKNIPASKSKRMRNLTRQIIPEPSTINGKAKLTSKVTRVPKASDDVPARERATKDRRSLQGAGVHSAALDASSTSSDAETTIMKCVATAMVMGAKTGAAKESGIITMKGLMATDKKSSEFALPPKTQPRNMKMVVTAKVGGSREAVMNVDEINVNKETKTLTVKCDDKNVNDTDGADSSINQTNSLTVDNSDLEDTKEDDVMYFQCWSWYSTRPATKYSIEDSNNSLLAPKQHDGAAQNEQCMSSLLETLGGNQEDQALSIRSAEATANDWIQRDRDRGDSPDPSDMTTVYQRKEENIKKWSTIMVADEYSEETNGSKRTDQRQIAVKRNTDSLQTIPRNPCMNQGDESEIHSEETYTVRTSNIPVKAYSSKNKPSLTTAVITRDQRLKVDVLKVDNGEVNSIAKSKTEKKITGTGAITDLKGKTSKTTTEDAHAVTRSNIPVKTREPNRTHTANDITDIGILTEEVTRIGHKILTVTGAKSTDIKRHGVKIETKDTDADRGDQAPESDADADRGDQAPQPDTDADRGDQAPESDADAQENTDQPRFERFDASKLKNSEAGLVKDSEWKRGVSKSKETTKTREVNIQEAILINTNVPKEQGDILNSGTLQMKTTPLPTSVSKRQDGRPKPGEKKDADRVKSQEAPEDNTKISKEIGDTKVSKEQGGRSYSEEKNSKSKMKITETRRADSSLSKEQGAKSKGREKNESSPVKIQETRPVSTSVSKRQDGTPKSEEREDAPVAKIKVTDSGNSKAAKEMADTKISKVKVEGATTGEMMERKGASKKNISDASLVTSNVSKTHGEIPEPGEDNDPPKVKTQGTSLVTTKVLKEHGDGPKSGVRKDALSVKIKTVVTSGVPNKQTGKSKPVEKKEASQDNPMVSSERGDTNVSQVQGDRPNPGETMRITETSRDGTTGSKEQGVRSVAREKTEPPPMKIPETRPVSTSVSKRQDSRPKSEERKAAPVAKIKVTDSGNSEAATGMSDAKISKVKVEGATTEEMIPQDGAGDTSVSRVIGDGAKPGEMKRATKTNITDASQVTSYISTEKGRIPEPVAKNDTRKEVKIPESHPSNTSVTPARGGNTISKVEDDRAKPGERKGASKKNILDASLVTANVSKKHGEIPEPDEDNDPPKVKTQGTSLVTTNVSKERCDGPKSGVRNDALSVKIKTVVTTGVPSKETGKSIPVEKKEASQDSPMVSSERGDTNVSQVQGDRPNPGETMRITETSRDGTTGSKEQGVRSVAREKTEPPPMKIPETRSVSTSVSKRQDSRPKSEERKAAPVAKIKVTDSGNSEAATGMSDAKISKVKVEGATTEEMIPQDGAGDTSVSRVIGDGAKPGEMKRATKTNITDASQVTSYISTEKGRIPEPVAKNDTRKEVKIPESHPSNTSVTPARGDNTRPVSTSVSKRQDSRPKSEERKASPVETSLVTTNGSKEQSDKAESGEKNSGSKMKITETSQDDTTVSKQQDVRLNAMEENESHPVKIQEMRPVPFSVSKEQDGGPKSGEKKNVPKAKIKEAGNSGNIKVSKVKSETDKTGETKRATKKNIPESGPGNTNVMKGQGDTKYSRVEGDGVEPEESKDASKRNSSEASLVTSNIYSQQGGIPEPGATKKNIPGASLDTTHISSEKGGIPEPLGKNVTPKVKIPETHPGDTGVTLLRDDNMLSKVEGDVAGERKDALNVNIPSLDEVTSDVEQAGRSKSGEKEDAHKVNIQEAPQGHTTVSKEIGDRSYSEEKNSRSKMKITETSRADSSLSKEQGAKSKGREKNKSSPVKIQETRPVSTSVSKRPDGRPKSEERKDARIVKIKEASSCNSEAAKEMVDTKVSKVKGGGAKTGGMKATSNAKIPQEVTGDTSGSRVIGDGAKPWATKRATKTNIPDASLVTSYISTDSVEKNVTPKVKNSESHPRNTIVIPARGDNTTSKVEGDRAKPGERRDASKRKIPGASLDTSTISSQQDDKPEPVKKNTTLTGTTKEAGQRNTEVTREKGTTNASNIKSDGDQHGEMNASFKEGNKTRAMISNSAEGNSQYFQKHDGRSEMGEGRTLKHEDRNDSSRVKILDEGTGNTKFSHFQNGILKSGTRDGAANLKNPDADLNDAEESSSQGDGPDHRGPTDQPIGNTRKTGAVKTTYREGRNTHGEGRDSSKYNVARTARSTTPCGPRGVRKISPTVKIQVTRPGNTKESKVHVAKSKLEGWKHAPRLKNRGLGFTNASQGHGGKSKTLKSKGSPKVMIPETGAHKIKDAQSRRQGERKYTHRKASTGIKKCASHRMSRTLKGTRTSTVGEGRPATVVNRENLSRGDSGFRGRGTNTSNVLASFRGPVFLNVKWDGNSTMKDIFSWRPVTKTVSKQSTGEHDSTSGGTKHEKVSHGDHFNCYCHPKCSCKFNETCFCGKQAGHW